MMLFGRSKHLLECIATEFLPSDEQLHVIVADADMNLQVLQYDPESMFLPPGLMHHTNIEKQIPNLQADHASFTNLPSTPPTSQQLSHSSSLPSRCPRALSSGQPTATMTTT